jgi:hypothetical protein
MNVSFQDRPKGGVTGEKVIFAKDHPAIDTLGAAVKVVQPTVIIGKMQQFFLHLATNHHYR